MQDALVVDHESPKKKALIVIHIESCFPELLNVARLLKQSGRYEPIFLFVEGYYATIQRDMLTCEAEHIPHLNPLSEPGRHLLHETLAGRLWHLVLSSVPEALAETVKFSIFGSVPYQLWRHSQRLGFVKRLIQKEQISLLIPGLDLAHYDTSLFIKAAHLQRTPAVIVTDMMTIAAEYGDWYYHNPRHSLERWPNQLVGTLYPRWVLEHKDRKLLRLPSAGMVLAKEWLGLAPPLPWQIHSGYADAILVESERMRSLGILNGLPAEQLIATGNMSQDTMAKVLRDAPRQRAELYRKLNLPENKPMILLAMPQYATPRGYPQIFPIYDDMVQFLVSVLSACKDYNLVVCLHPSTEYDRIKHIEQWGAKIALEHTARLVALCDIFVASVSSTIKWAIACSKPTISFDFDCIRRPEYAEVKGVITVETKGDFLSALRNLTENKAFYDEIAMRQATHAAQWGQLDGNAGERILEVFDQQIAKYREA